MQIKSLTCHGWILQAAQQVLGNEMTVLCQGLHTRRLFKELSSYGCQATSKCVSTLNWVLDSRCENLRLSSSSSCLPSYSLPRADLQSSLSKACRRRHFSKRREGKGEGEKKGRKEARKGSRERGRRREGGRGRNISH